MSDAFTRSKLDWLDQVAAAVAPSAFLVAYRIVGHVNRKTGDAWPTHETLAVETQMSRRGVQKAIEALVAGGHLAVSVSRGRGGSNRYRPILKNANSGSHKSPDENANPSAHKAAQENANGGAHFAPADNANRGAHKAEEKCEPEFAFAASDNAHNATVKCAQIDKKMRTGVRTEHIEEHTEEHIEGARARRSIVPRHRLEDSWTPSEADRNFALEKGFSEAEIDRHAEAFSDYWRSPDRTPAKALKRDWPGAWRNWIRKERPSRPNGSSGHMPRYLQGLAEYALGGDR